MRFTTMSGSVYEINTDSKQIRRLNGVRDPSPRQGKDGEWRKYDDIYPNPPKVGQVLVIKWDNNTELTEAGKEVAAIGMPVLPLTTTSPLTKIET